MSNRLQDIEAFLAGDRRQAELALAYNGINLKEHFPSLSSEERVEAVRIARHLLAEWSGSEGAAAVTPKAHVQGDKIADRLGEQRKDEPWKTKARRPASADSGLHAEPDEHIAPIAASDQNNRWMLLVALLILAAGIAAIFGQRLLDFSSTFQLQDVTDDTGQVAETESSATPASESEQVGAAPLAGEPSADDLGSAEETELRNRVAAMLKAEQKEADRLATQPQDAGPESGAQTSALSAPEAAPQPEPESAAEVAPTQPAAADPVLQTAPESGTSESDTSAVSEASAQPQTEVPAASRETSEAALPAQSGQQRAQTTAQDAEPSNTLSALIRAAGEDDGPREDESAQSWLIRRVQTSLVELGYNPGPIDGIMGPRTQTGIEEFQRAEGLPVDGEMNARLLDTLTQRISD